MILIWKVFGLAVIHFKGKARGKLILVLIGRVELDASDFYLFIIIVNIDAIQVERNDFWIGSILIEF